MIERCAICNCLLHRAGGYAKPTVEGRSHASEHHHVAERFFGRSTNRKGTKREALFTTCPWNSERKATVLCYDCHELLLHNPILLLEDIRRFAALVERRGLSEDQKPEDLTKIAGRIALFHDLISRGIAVMYEEDAGLA